MNHIGPWYQVERADGVFELCRDQTLPDGTVIRRGWILRDPADPVRGGHYNIAAYSARYACIDLGQQLLFSHWVDDLEEAKLRVDLTLEPAWLETPSLTQRGISWIHEHESGLVMCVGPGGMSWYSWGLLQPNGQRDRAFPMRMFARSWADVSTTVRAAADWRHQQPDAHEATGVRAKILGRVGEAVLNGDRRQAMDGVRIYCDWLDQHGSDLDRGMANSIRVDLARGATAAIHEMHVGPQLTDPLRMMVCLVDSFDTLIRFLGWA